MWRTLRSMEGENEGDHVKGEMKIREKCAKGGKIEEKTVGISVGRGGGGRGSRE